MKRLVSVFCAAAMAAAGFGVAQAEEAPGVIALAADSSGGTAAAAAPAASSDDSKCSSDITKCFTAGFIVSSSVGAHRVSSIKFVKTDSGSVYAQVANNPTVQYGLAGTLSLLENNRNIYSTAKWKWPLDILLCGPFAFTPSPGPNGCGPIFVGALTSGSSAIGQVGAGWAIDLGQQIPKMPNLALSFGVLVNPNDTVLDKRVIDGDTMLVRSGFEGPATAGTLSGTVSKTTAGLFTALSFELGGSKSGG